MDGFEVAQLVRRRERTAHTPIIFISAISPSETHASRGYALGAVDYIFAPIDADVLRAKVSVFVELYRQTREAKLQAQRVAERTRELEASYQQLRLTERMAALGTLSAGLGHDLGNLLLPIRARLDVLDSKSLSPDVQEELDGIRKCLDYLRRLASGLRLLSLDPADTLASTAVDDLRDWWVEAEPFFRNAVPDGVILTHRITQGLPRLSVPRHSLTQAVFNLIQNAGDALRPRGFGHISVWAEPGDSQQEVRVGVTDDGPGMTPDVRKRCLEPFFTTKTRGLSTGLGLALVHGIAEEARGSLDVSSEVGAGTTFTLTLPGTPLSASVNTGRPLLSHRAIISVSDPRRRAYIEAILRHLDVEVAPDDSADDAKVRLWITDAGHDCAPRADQFVRANTSRRLVVLGPCESANGCERIVGINDPSDPVVVREALQSVATVLGAR
jgi:signal transduction histidine kinase